MEPTSEAPYRIATVNRLRAADLLAGLTPEQWRTPSLCAGWTVRDIAGHLVDALETKTGVVRMMLALIRYRGSLDRMVDARARRSARRSTADLVAGLRELAAVRLNPPVIGPLGPMTDSLIHLRDIARPLGVGATPPPDEWRVVLDLLADPRPATRNLVPRDRLGGLRLVATDQAWQHGAGREVRGPSEALAMAISGRPAALADLEGEGVALLSDRLQPQ